MNPRPRFAALLAFFVLGILACHSQTAPPAPSPNSLPEDASQGLQTRTFRVPPDFLSKGTTSAGNLVKPTAEAILQSLGITFEVPGANAVFYPKTALLKLTNTAEQLENMEAISQIMVDTIQQGQVHLEIFSMPPLTARKALIARPKESDLHAWIDAELAKPDSTVKLERHTITILRGGQKAKTESVNEIPAPTEFNPPQIPQTATMPANAQGTSTPDGTATFAPWPRTETQPCSFEFRRAGNTLEVEAVFEDGNKTVDLNLAAESSRRVGIAKFGLLEEVYQPIYETQRCATQASAFVDQPMLISTFSPATNTGIPGGNQVDRLWLLFVTVKALE